MSDLTFDDKLIQGFTKTGIEATVAIANFGYIRNVYLQNIMKLYCREVGRLPISENKLISWFEKQKWDLLFDGYRSGAIC